ncbi:PREDICTED: DNA repair protein complementing XP-G cells homolog [Rhagoletis zephyria]|uniref:DNA repair protein complementing XP-G cells homolog n=1 Tax=Rhagoletis zephyria TaxID=28612 RepID=UPI0008118199|nr:PREDICTED: DNA repair protein complementing XP-G cells homolog [Rhagoletis zephyria]
MAASGKCSEIKNDEEMQYDKTNALPYVLNMNDDNKKMSSILDELKKQADNVKNLNLDDVNICESDEKFRSKNEIIEIYDSDDQKLSSEVTPSKSTKFRTPSKDKSIKEYFETKYVVKRTPESDKTEQEEKQASNVNSPFFVKKSPSSHRKRSVRKISASPIHGHKLSRVSKTLFESATTTSEKKLEIKEDGPDLKSEDVPKSAVGILKQQKTTEQLQSLASDLVKERRDLENERNRQDRMGTAITHNMHTECQELLKLFGVPYIIAPMEAEAQCAFLESVNLTNGTITDDSDIWLFGGRTVYKNFFEQNKHVLKFEADKIRHTFNCDREQLIQLACLVGSDYTTGIHGIGTVTALEILATFSLKSKNSQESCTRNDTTTDAVLSTLYRFRDWLKVHKNLCQPVGSSTCLKLRKKLNNIELNEGFPSPAVVEAYLFPKVDDSKAAFQWGYPDVDSLYAFTKRVFGWTAKKTDSVLKPVLKRMNDKQTQASIRNYFTIKSALKPRELKISKRVQKAIDTMASAADTSDIIDIKPAKRSRRTKKQNDASKTQQQLELDSNGPDAMTNIVVDIPSTSASCLAHKMSKSTPRLLETKEVIPQREKDIQKMRQRKQKAAAVLRKSRALASITTGIEERRAN